MLNWNEISKLLVVQKLQEIVRKWFGVELIYANEHYKIQGNLFDKGHHFENYFLKVQMNLSYGHEYISHDVEQIVEKFNQQNENSNFFDSFFPSVKIAAAKIKIDGEFAGIIFAYPFTFENLTNESEEDLKNKLTEFGALPAHAGDAVHSLKRLNAFEKDYLLALIDLVAQEVITYHHEITKREERILELNSELSTKYRYHSMIGKSKKMQQIYHLLEKISRSESTVLIQGENGTGKELVAKAIHYNSSRRDSVFLAQNCSAFNDNLLDSELFGHVKGAFTGAIKDKKGLFEMANGGTLFLDEIGDTSLSMQVKLLRVLQEGTFLPVGASSPKKVNVRILAATNRDLKEMISKGEFREDLYYRINVINIFLPSLRERKEDIVILAEHFLEQRCAEAGCARKTISKKCLEKLLDYAWPGNVRELENEIERLVILAGESRTITPDMLSARITELGEHVVSSGSKGFKMDGTLKEALEELEMIMIHDGLKRCNYNKSRLSKELGISRASLIMKIEKYGLDKKKNLLKAV